MKRNLILFLFKKKDNYIAKNEQFEMCFSQV